MFCIYKTDPNWIKALRSFRPDVLVNFWRKGTNELKLPSDSWFYFNPRRTTHVVGRGVLVGYEVMSIGQAWELYGRGNGVSSLEELELRLAQIIDITNKNTQIGCILLSELQFLKVGNEYGLSNFGGQGPVVKYFKDADLSDLHKIFENHHVPSLSDREKQLKKYYEGKVQYSYRVGYERRPEVRKACLDFHGYKCKACGILLENKYGSIARNFIHVHHLRKISDAGAEREVNPITDLVPLCPNCHSVAHRKEPPFTVEELCAFIHSRGKT